MIKLTNFSMPLRFTEDILRQKIAQRLHISAQEIQSVLYLKRSVDARKKTENYCDFDRCSCCFK